MFDPGFNPGHLATASGFALAIVFSVQGLTGWESAVPLAEETGQSAPQRPDRHHGIDRDHRGDDASSSSGVRSSAGAGSRLTKLPTSAELPALVIAHRVWGAVWWIALFAMFTSVMAASLATQNVATRMWYGMARTGVLPGVVARVDPKRKTPTVAVLLQFLLSMGLGLHRRRAARPGGASSS